MTQSGQGKEEVTNLSLMSDNLTTSDAEAAVERHLHQLFQRGRRQSSLPYQVAVTVLTAWAGVARTIRPARAKNRMMSTCFSLSLKAGIRGGKGGSSLCLGFSLGELAEAIGLPL